MAPIGATCPHKCLNYAKNSLMVSRLVNFAKPSFFVFLMLTKSTLDLSNGR
jgi:hypothetical protein